MSQMRKLARNVARTRMQKMNGSYLNSKRSGKSPFAIHWREFTDGKFKTEPEESK